MTATSISLAQTLSIGSIEAFLTDEEAEALTALMNTFISDDTAGNGRRPYDSERRTSIHEIPGHDPETVKAIYEPASRVEIAHIPSQAEHILQVAFHRARHRITRFMPAVTSCRPWTYVEYGPGQHITAHLDGIAPDPLTWPRQVAGISVTLPSIHRGGEFYVETTADDTLWNTTTAEPESGYQPDMAFAHDGADNSTPWFQAIHRTRWTTTPAPGTALLYGSQLAHGTLPVTWGRNRKFISWLLADGAPQ